MSTPAKQMRSRAKRPDTPPAPDQAVQAPQPEKASPQPEKASQKTLYEVSTPLIASAVDGTEVTTWHPVARLEAADARAAAKEWASGVGEDVYAGGVLRIVPVRNITETPGKVTVIRQLTFE